MIARFVLPLLASSLLPSFGQEMKIPAATKIAVRTIDKIDSKAGQPGDTYKASLTEPITVNGSDIAARGADAELKIVEVKSAGRLRGKAELSVTLTAITAGGQKVPVTADVNTDASEGKGKGSAIKTGIGAGLGAAIGGIAGGGKGAAIGSAAGATGGAAVAMVTSGPRVTLPAETILVFTTK